MKRALVFLIVSVRLAAQAPESPSRFGQPVQLSGEVAVGSDLYRATGISPRRPGSAWHTSLTPRLTLLGEFNVGADILVSSEGSQFRQNVSQFGLNPRYRWATLHVGDFSRNLSSYTVQGTRVRGAGLDLNPGIVRFSVQGGRLQRAVADGAGGLGYTRHLVAASVGLGREEGSFIDLIAFRAKDDTASLAAVLSDTLLLDTIPAALQPRYQVRPKENTVVGTQGQFYLFHRALNVKGEGALALITRDLDSPAADPAMVSAGGIAGKLVPLTLSTSGDYAWKLDASYAAGPASIRAGYDYVGAGFTSLGLAYVINDRRSYTLGGSDRLFGNRVTLQGQFQHQNDNLLRQKASTTNRDALAGSASVIVSRNVMANVSVMTSGIANDAAVDTFVVDNHALAVTANAALQHRLADKPAALTLSWSMQRTHDGNAVTAIPDAGVRNVSAAWQVTLKPGLSVAPSLSLAETSSPGSASQRNMFVGGRAQARLGAVRSSFSATKAWANSRGIFTVLGQGSYALPLDTRLVVQLRHARYDAVGTRPGFAESFATTSITRGF